MSNDIPRSYALPANPDLEHLKNEAKERLALLRATAPGAQLAEAQFQLARDYGFPSWRALKDKVEGRDDDLSACAGFYQHDPALMKNFYVHVTRNDGQLLVGNIIGGNFELARQEDGRFTSPGLPEVYSFEKDEVGRAGVMIVDAAGRQSRLMRIDAATVLRIDAANAMAREEQRRPRTAITLAPEVLERYVGHYASSLGGGVAVEITRRDAILYAQMSGQPRIPLSAEADDVFFYTVVPAQIHFRVAAGKATALVLHQNGVERVMPRVSAEKAAEAGAQIAIRLQEQQKPRQLVSVPTDILERYAGRYRIPGNRVMVVTAEEGKLVAQITGQPKHEIFPESPTKFFWTVMASQIEFYLDHSQHVSHAVLHQFGRLIPLARLDDKEAEA
jgi:hypothetical protein